MQIRTYPLGSLETNCYFLLEDKKCLIIDPADSADFISEKLERERLELVGLVATHGHFDHIMAVGELQMSYQVPLYIHEKDMFLVKRLNETAKYFLGYDPGSMFPKNISYFPQGKLKIGLLAGGWKFEIIETPGHTPGSCCIYFPEENTIFTGDTLFKQGIGSYEHSYSNKKILFQSLSELFKLPEDTIVYPGHGDETIIGDERKGQI